MPATSAPFNPLESSVLFTLPDWLEPSAWIEHVPFAMFVMENLRPRNFVELGTWRGTSYCSFCQAASILNLPATCHAVDTWAGDEHTGALPSAVYDELKAHHDSRFGKFSTLHRCTFEEANARFPDASIDLLHIDGLHTYDAVSHDFNSWLPKLTPNAVVLFHDTAVVEWGFGVHQFFNELKPRFRHFEFLHGFGLGVLAFGAGYPASFEKLLAADPATTTRLRTLFECLGQRLSATCSNRLLQQQIAADKHSKAGRMVSALRSVSYAVRHPIAACTRLF